MRYSVICNILSYVFQAPLNGLYLDLWRYTNILIIIIIAIIIIIIANNIAIIIIIIIIIRLFSEHTHHLACLSE